MFKFGLLAIIKHLLNKAKMKYLSKLSNTINYIKLNKALLSLSCKKVIISIKSGYSIEAINNLKSAIDAMKNTIDLYKTIKYIVKKFNEVKEKSKKQALTVNNNTQPDFLKLLDKARSREKLDLFIRDVCRNNHDITVYTLYTIGSSGINDISFVERHINFVMDTDHDINNEIYSPRYIDYLDRTPLLLDVLFAYAHLRNIAYAYQYIRLFPADADRPLNRDKADLFNVPNLIRLAQELGIVYPNEIHTFCLAGIQRAIHTYTESLRSGDQQVDAINERYRDIEAII